MKNPLILLVSLWVISQVVYLTYFSQLEIDSNTSYVDVILSVFCGVTVTTLLALIVFIIINDVVLRARKNKM